MSGMLYWRYGNYSFPAGAVEFTTSAERTYSARGNPFSIRRRIDLSVTLQADTPAGLTSLLNELYSNLVPGRDLGLYESNGNPTAHFWRDSETFGGIRVISDGNPVGDGTEYTTYRTVTISFEADFPIRGLDRLLSYTETVTIVGDGGPEEIYLPLLRGKWQRQQVTERSLVTATQSGEIVLWGRKPTLADCPKPIWPSFEIRPQRSFNQMSGQNVAGDFGEYKASYSYSFQSNEPLTGSAHDL